jgi:hypothetical protein
MPNGLDRVVVFTAVALLTASGCVAPKAPLEGAWKVVDIVVTGADSATIHSPQPSLYIFTSRHYSLMSVIGSEPRALYKAETPTDSERITAFNSFVANTGTYDITDSTLTLHPVVARYPNFMAGGNQKQHFHVVGDTLWLTLKSNDLWLRLGDQIVQSTDTGSVTHTKLVRQP